MRIFGLFLAIAIALATMVMPSTANAQVYVSFSAPPPLQMEMQPQLSTPNSIWTPGYWARGPSGYYWVSGSWAQAPQPGYLWTPSYWGYSQNQYNYNPGYWGQQVGYYGGINYGNGYYGNGYYGGNWQGNTFRYNTAVSRINPFRIRNVYVNRTVVVRTINRTSYNGGVGGIRMHPDAGQLAYARQHHIYATSTQRQRAIDAARDRHNYYRTRSEPMHAGTRPVAGPVHVTSRPPQHVKPAARAVREKNGHAPPSA